MRRRASATVKSFARMAPTLAPRDRFLIMHHRVRAAESGTLADCIIALSAVWRGITGAAQSSGQGTGQGILRARRASPDRDAGTRCLSSLEEQ